MAYSVPRPYYGRGMRNPWMYAIGEAMKAFGAIYGQGLAEQQRKAEEGTRAAESEVERIEGGQRDLAARIAERAAQAGSLEELQALQAITKGQLPSGGSYVTESGYAAAPVALPGQLTREDVSPSIRARREQLSNEQIQAIFREATALVGQGETAKEAMELAGANVAGRPETQLSEAQKGRLGEREERVAAEKADKEEADRLLKEGRELDIRLKREALAAATAPEATGQDRLRAAILTAAGISLWGPQIALKAARGETITEEDMPDPRHREILTLATGFVEEIARNLLPGEQLTEGDFDRAIEQAEALLAAAERARTPPGRPSGPVQMGRPSDRVQTQEPASEIDQSLANQAIAAIQSGEASLDQVLAKLRERAEQIRAAGGDPSRIEELIRAAARQ